MGFLDILKKPPEQEQGKMIMPGPPTDKVTMMRQNGMTNNQIIQALQNEGHGTTDIFDAMNQADLKGGVGMAQPQRGPSIQGAPPGMGQPMGPPPGGQMPPMDPYQDEGAPQSYEQPDNNSGVGERIEEIAEAIIDEKWNEIVKSINKIADWKDQTESRLTKIEQQMVDMKTSFDQLHKGVLGKIGEYDKNLTNISSEIHAMDMVFQKVLPVMTENVKEMGRITDDMKKR